MIDASDILISRSSRERLLVELGAIISEGDFSKSIELGQVKYRDALLLVGRYKQPGSWISKEKNPSTGEYFEYNPISVIDNLVGAVCAKSNVRIRKCEVIEVSGGIIVTVQCEVWLYGCNYLHEGESCADSVHLDGIASSFGRKEDVNLLVPKTLVIAKKNALKQLGPLFGRDLNRGYEDRETIAEPHPIPELTKDSLKLSSGSQAVLDKIKKADKLKKPSKNA